MTRLVLLVVLLSILKISQGYLYSEDVEKHFAAFKGKYRSYSSPEEESRRKSIFTANMKEIDRLNEINGQPVFGINKFADQTKEEINVRNGFKIPATSTAKPTNISPRKIQKNPYLDDATDVSSVNAVNWADPTLNIVTPVKNQGQCGSCWAHSTAEQIESQWAIEGSDGEFTVGGEIWEFSVQQIISCTTTCQGCGGGWQQDAYEYIETLTSANEGLGSQYFAPYTQSMVTQCTSASCTRACSQLDVSALTEYASLTGPFATIQGWNYVTPTCLDNSQSSTCNNQNMTAIQDYLTTSGPIAIVVNAGAWGSYTGGVMTAATCGSSTASSMDHAVQLVGFNATSSTPYWIVRNSWSTDWGESGYIYLSYPGNTCGIANSATYVSILNGQDNFTGRR